MKVVLIVIGSLVLTSAGVLFLYGFLGFTFSDKIEASMIKDQAVECNVGETWCNNQ